MILSLCAQELQIRGGIEDNSKIIFVFLNKNICCDPSFDHLGETVLIMMGHKIRFYGEIWLIIPKLSLLPLLYWSTDYRIAAISHNVQHAYVHCSEITLSQSHDVTVIQWIMSCRKNRMTTRIITL